MTDRLRHGSPHKVAELVPNRPVTQNLPEEYEGYKMSFAFSGALSEEDLEVAKHGIEIMKQLLSRQQ